jgi:hypothetical protein
MLTIHETEFIETEARVAAEQEHVQLVNQPFNGAMSFEFRRKGKNGVECFGLIYGSPEITLFRRQLSLRYVWSRERLWWLGALICRKSSDVNYRDVGRIKFDDVKRDILVELIQKYLPVSAKMKSTHD